MKYKLTLLRIKFYHWRKRLWKKRLSKRIIKSIKLGEKIDEEKNEIMEFLNVNEL